MHHHLTGPLWGNIVILIIAGIITLGCFGAMLRMLWRPGETNPRHAKYDIFRNDG
jgi:hypothetical protein